MTISRNLSSIPNTITANTIIDSTGNTVPISTVVQGTAKAWVSYNGSAQTIYSSFNCSSVTYNSATNYTFNFANTMPNANYAVLCTIGGAVAQAGLAPWGTPTTSSFVFTMGGSTNPTYVSVAVFR
jgi:N-methylhydantoinase B/oxoprolinase/acetone carboxylase alpha subunit